MPTAEEGGMRTCPTRQQQLDIPKPALSPSSGLRPTCHSFAAAALPGSVVGDSAQISRPNPSGLARKDCVAGMWRSGLDHVRDRAVVRIGGHPYATGIHYRHIADPNHAGHVRVAT
jgi:hypothetical protein